MVKFFTMLILPLAIYTAPTIAEASTLQLKSGSVEVRETITFIGEDNIKLNVFHFKIDKQYISIKKSGDRWVVAKTSSEFYTLTKKNGTKFKVNVNNVKGLG